VGERGVLENMHEEIHLGRRRTKNTPKIIRLLFLGLELKSVNTEENMMREQGALGIKPEGIHVGGGGGRLKVNLEYVMGFLWGEGT
jgi:hypothetical protein